MQLTKDIGSILLVKADPADADAGGGGESED